MTKSTPGVENNQHERLFADRLLESPCARTNRDLSEVSGNCGLSSDALSARCPLSISSEPWARARFLRGFQGYKSLGRLARPRTADHPGIDRREEQGTQWTL